MDLTEVVKNIFHTKFEKQEDLAFTFLRFQEHYESPVFRGKIFSMDEYRKWYVANSPEGRKNGRFTYDEDWEGFNVPSHVFEPFYGGEFNPLSPREVNLLDALVNKMGTKFYVIGTLGDDYGTDKHEIAHGLFYTNPEYHYEVIHTLASLPHGLKNGVLNYIKSSGGYHESVFTDEMHAYLLTDLKALRKFGLNKKELRTARIKLDKIFYKYAPDLEIGQSSFLSDFIDKVVGNKQ